MTLLVIAYPEWSAKDLELVESFRRDNDALFSVVRPHFTFVFPVVDLVAGDFAAEVRKQSEDFPSIPFCLRCATISNNAVAGGFHGFLVPDEGFGQMIRLHDKLYSGLLYSHRRFDLDYIPHITIATGPDRRHCEKIVDSLNARSFSITGTISTLDIVNYENGKIGTVEKILLAKGNPHDRFQAT
jgi:2'-5' RNA ligase